MKGLKKVNDKGNLYIKNETGGTVNLAIFENNELKGLYRDFANFNLEFFKWLATQQLTGRQCKILFYLIGKMQFENRITITYKEIYTSLKIHKSNLSVDLRKLIDKQIVLKTKLPSKKYEIKLNMGNMFLNQQMAFKGKRTNKALIKEHKELATRNSPYIDKKNLDGDYDLFDRKGNFLAFGNKKIANDHPIKNKEPIPIEPTQEQKNDSEKIRELEMKISDIKRKNTEMELKNNELESPRKAVGVWSTAKELAENHYKITAENELHSKIISEKTKKDPNFHNEYVGEILKIMQEEKKAKKRREEIKLKAQEHKKMQTQTH